MTDDKSFEEEISMFLRRNFPQIQMHGGESSVLTADEESGTVEIALGGACSGCGISPMTVQAIKRRMVQEIDTVEKVSVSTDAGMGGFGTGADAPAFEEGDEDESEPNIDAPF